MIPHRADVVICGAGIAGVAAAHALAQRQGVGDILLVDAGPPLSMTSDKSTEAYRNFWPGPDAAMVQLMNRSVDLLEELARRTANRFRMNRRGYVYATADPERAQSLARAAENAEAFGAGPLRTHTAPQAPSYAPSRAEGFEGEPEGADLLLHPELLRAHFPYVTPRAVAALHVRRCGWFAGQQLGMLLLEEARLRHVRLVQAKLEGVETAAGAVQAVHLRAPGEARRVQTSCFVNAAGPYARDVAHLLDVDLPIHCELHWKAAFRDSLAAIPRTAPLLVWDDAQTLEWEEEEREVLQSTPESRWLLEPLPAGVHARPEGGLQSQQVLLLWPYHAQPETVRFPLEPDSVFPEIALRGLSAMLPGLRAYWEALPRAFVDGGYYVKTRENRCLVGPLPRRGAYVMGAFSGYGLMAACGAADLLAMHILGDPLPAHAAAFGLERYADTEYVKRLDAWGPTGEL